MNAYEVNPYIRLAINSVLPPFTHIKRRIIFDYELIYIEKGNFIFKYNDIEYQCKKGDFIMICPGISHSFRLSNEEVSQPHIHFDLIYDAYSESIPISFKDITEFTYEEKKLIRKNAFEEYSNAPFIKICDENRFFNLWKKIIGNTENDILTKKAALTEIIAMIAEDNFTGCFCGYIQNNSVAKHLKDYIDAGQGINADLSSFEKQFTYSRFYLEREFKKLYGVGIIAYRNSKRMELASGMLKNKTVSEVVERLHFSSIYSFSRSFKNYYGISPTEYKKKIQFKS